MNKQDAIEMLKSMLPEKISYAELVGAVGCYGNGGYVYADPEPYAIEMAISALTQQLNDGWIPVSQETNPKKSDIYLVTFVEGGNRYVERFSYSDFTGWMMPIAWQDEGHIDNLIAWRDMPEPYKEASE